MTFLPVDTILQGDCVQKLNELPEKCVDLIFADPPYNLQLHQNLRRPDNSSVEAVNEDWDRFEDFSAYDQFTVEWLQACRRVLKSSASIWVIGAYHNIYRIGKILQDLNFWILNDVIWIKANPMPNFRGVRLTNAHEILIWAKKDKGATYTFNHHSMKALNENLQMRSDWYLPICTGRERLRINGKRAHPTQKPEALLYRVLEASTQPGDVVLDPFFGTGTTGVVAKKLHRNWIGIEREERYIEMARKRIDGTSQQPYDRETYDSPQPRKQPRIPFGMLLETGMLSPGQELFYGKNGDQTAKVLADGRIEFEGENGSIHQIAGKIRKSPCNGWEQWYYFDPDKGERISIDTLRKRLRIRDNADK